MANPRKLEAFVNQGTPKARAGARKPEPQAPSAAEESESEEAEDTGPAPKDVDEVMELADEITPLVELLEEHAEDIEEQCELLDDGLLTDPDAPMDPDFRATIEGCLDALDPGLVEAMREHMAGIAYEEAVQLAEHLADEGKVADAEVVGGFLFHAGQTF